MAAYTSLYLQGDDGCGSAARSQMWIPFRRQAIRVVVSGPRTVRGGQCFDICWAAGDDCERMTFSGELYVGTSMAPESGSIVLRGRFLSQQMPAHNRTAGAGRPIALAVGRTLIRDLRVAIESAYCIHAPRIDPIRYALRYTN